MAKASTTTTLNDTDGTALYANDRVQATDNEQVGTVVSFTAKRVRIKWDGIDYPSTRHYAQVVPTKVRKIDADVERAEKTAEGIAQRAAEATQAERDRVADAITEVAATITPRYFMRASVVGAGLATPLDTLEGNAYGLNHHALRPLRQAGIIAVEQLADLVDVHLKDPKESQLAAIPGLGKTRIGKLVRAVMFWRDINGQGAEDIADQAPQTEQAEQAPVTATTGHVVPGTGTMARPVRNGSRTTKPVRALVLAVEDDQVRLWFPSLGTLDTDHNAVQTHTLADCEGEPIALADCPSSWVVHNRRRATRDGSYTNMPDEVWTAFSEASEAHHQAWVARQAAKKASK